MPNAGVRAAGFTLIEILVVVFIVSIMTGLAVANMPSFTRTGEFDTEARRLLTLLRMVREEAVLQATEYGLSARPDGYEFMVYDDLAGSWSTATARPFQARRLPDGIELALEVEDTQLAIATRDDDESGEGGVADKPPPVLLLSSGETTPFRLRITMPEASREQTLVADGYSQIRWEETETNGSP